MSSMENTDIPVDSSNAAVIKFPIFAASVLISGGFILAMIFYAIRVPTVAETKQLFLPLTPSFLAETASIPARVNTGLRINNMREFDFVNNNFVLDGTVWFAFDPAIISLDTVSSFAFENADMKSKSAPETRILEGGQMLARFDIILKFLPQLDFKIFPIDDHAISLLLLNTKASPREMIFESTNKDLLVVADTRATGWEKFHQQVDTGYISEDIRVQAATQKMRHPATAFTLYYRRSSVKYPAVLILPMFVLMMIMLSTFCYDPKKYFSAIMAANGASLTGLIGFRFVMENSSPKVGYFLLSDYIFVAFVVLAAIIFLSGVFLEKLSLRAKYIVMGFVQLMVMATFVMVVGKALTYRVYVVDLPVQRKEQ